MSYWMETHREQSKPDRVTQLTEHGKLLSIIDSVYGFDGYEKGFARTSDPGKRGRIIRKIDNQSLAFECDAISCKVKRGSELLPW